MEKTFELKNLKLTMFGGVDCKYQISETSDEGVTTENDYHVKVSRQIHPDLENLFAKDLTDIVAHILDNTQYMTDEELGIKEIYPTAISFAGKNDNIGISIAGFIQTECGRVTFKTPRIKYLIGESDISAKLTVFADKVVEETHAYLFDNKTAELEVFGE